MFDQVPSGSADSPIVLRANASMAWAWVLFAAVFAFALVRGYLGAATTAGRIGAVAFMGSCVVLLLWAAIYMVLRRPTMEISASEIVFAKAQTARTRAAGPQVLVLDRSSGSDLRVLTRTRGTRRYVTGLTLHGSGTTLPIGTFVFDQVKQACLAKGWQFTS
ncbi:MAG TPA: hypothetical protein VMA95_16075 [Streptosporangiaceae bacterium]|nr:hypothetical protein [Streptosporangiaceae bacterium]